MQRRMSEAFKIPSGCIAVTPAAAWSFACTQEFGFLSMFAWLGGAREVQRMSDRCERLRCPARKLPSAPMLPAALVGYIFLDVLDGSAFTGDRPVQATCCPAGPVLMARRVNRFGRGAHQVSGVTDGFGSCRFAEALPVPHHAFAGFHDACLP